MTIRTIALTGGIASGKTTVANTFEILGAAVVDADHAARAVVAPGSDGLEALVKLFGRNITTSEGTLNRAALRQLIFQETSVRKQVESILHPKIRQWMEATVAEKRQAGFEHVIESIPLLLETQQQQRFDLVIVVDTPIEMQLTRLMSRDNCSLAQAEQILATQATRSEKRAIADIIITNDSSLEDLKKRVANAYQMIKDTDTKIKH